MNLGVTQALWLNLSGVLVSAVRLPNLPIPHLVGKMGVLSHSGS